MFTGIVEKTLQVVNVADGPKFRRLTLSNQWPDVQSGASIAVNGVCLTVAEPPSQQSGGHLAFDVVAETLDKTNLGMLKPGATVNAEQALRMGDRFDGHFVQGHIDGPAKLVHISIANDQWRLTLEVPKHLSRYLVPKGSVCLDGVSLTIAAVSGDCFDVALIPTTVAATNLTHQQPGYPFNFEADLTVKTIVATLDHLKILPKK
jgi:riboflavin synthase